MSESLPAALDRVLCAAVEEITGDENAAARPGQVALAHDILNAMNTMNDGEEPGHVLGAAPTGVGKSVAALAPAMLMAAQFGHRTVVSTESLSLQSQILDKDGPLVSRAVEKVTGYAPKVAVLKGFSNYACATSAYDAALEVVKAVGVKVRKDLEDPSETDLPDVLALLNKVTAAKAAATPFVTIGGRDWPTSSLRDLTAWALEANWTSSNGDRSSYPGDVPNGMWSTVSLSPAECPGTKSCNLASMCLPRQARTSAAEADIVVTNHSILAVQASMGVPVLLSNPNLGHFDHLVVDEAHALPGIVRDAGAREINERRVLALNNALRKILVDPSLADQPIDKEVAEGVFLAERVAVELAQFMRNTPGNEVRFESDTNPLAEAGRDLESWCTRVSRLIPAITTDMPVKTRLTLSRLSSRVDSLYDDLGVALGSKSGYARWVESAEGLNTLRVSPVDVGLSVSGNLYSVTIVPVTESGEEGEPESVPLSVTMISATLPIGFARAVNLRAVQRDYESPFESAYGGSMAYIPRVADPVELDRVSRTVNGRRRFDTALHTVWAAGQIVALVEANQGSALVLSATSRNGQEYVRHLRERFEPDIPVYSQWDGKDPRLITAAWVENPQSVLVGTRRFMTGVDAPGETCSLVIVDRAPRAAGNVVDDARVELLMERASMDKWSAERSVYVADATLLLEQAVGRLIRRVTDTGMVAVLDPRMLPGSPLAYPKATLELYLKALRRFGTRRADLSVAQAFLRDRRSGLEQSA